MTTRLLALALAGSALLATADGATMTPDEKAALAGLLLAVAGLCAIVCSRFNGSWRHG